MRSSRKRNKRFLLLVLIVVGCAAIAASVYIRQVVPSLHQRALEKLDEQRIADIDKLDAALKRAFVEHPSKPLFSEKLVASSTKAIINVISALAPLSATSGPASAAGMRAEQQLHETVAAFSALPALPPSDASSTILVSFPTHGPCGTIASSSFSNGWTAACDASTTALAVHSPSPACDNMDPTLLPPGWNYRCIQQYYVYISLPSNDPDCSDLDLPPLTTGWSYHCVPAEVLTEPDGTGWLPINLSAARRESLPLDPLNSANGETYYEFAEILSNTGNPPSYFLSSILDSEKHLSTTAFTVDPGRQSSYVEGSSTMSEKAHGLVFALDSADVSLAPKCSNEKCLNFRGNGDALVTKSPYDFSANMQGSYSFWFKLDSIPSQALSIFNPGTNRLDVNIEQGTGKFFLWYQDSHNVPSLVYKSSGSQYVGTGWHLVTVSKSSNNIFLYLDANNVATLPTTLPTYASTTNLVVASGLPTAQNIGLSVRKIRIFSISLTEDEVTREF